MASVVESVDVKAPVSTVYNQWTQFEDFARFMEGVKSVTQGDLERFKEFIESRGTETGAWRGNVEAALQR